MTESTEMADKSSDSEQMSIQAATSTIARQAMRINRLEEDNAVLRAQLESSMNSLATARSCDNCRAETLLADQQPYEGLAKKCEELQSQFDRLKRQHAGCEERVQAYREKCKEYKDWAKRWKTVLAEKNVIRPDESIASPNPQERPAKAGINPSATSGIISGYSSLPTSQSALPIVKEEDPPLSRLGILGVTSSQTTEDDTPPQLNTIAPAMQSNSSDSEPSFVSARSLKRKGNTVTTSERPTQRIKQEPLESVIELSSSSPRRSPAIHHEISDLDAIGARMVTPRKPRRIDDLPARPPSEEASPYRPDSARNASSYSEGDDCGATADFESGKGAHYNDPHSKHMHRDRIEAGQQTPSNGALKPLSVNVPTLHRSMGHSSGERRGVKRTGARDKVRLLSEDGEGASQHAGNETAKNGHDHLEDLLNEPPQERTPVLVRRAQEPFATSRTKIQAQHFPTPDSILKRPPPSRHARNPSKPKSPQPVSRNPAKREGPQRALRSPVKNAVSLRDSPNSVRPEDEPLRNQPLANLRLEDFKVNPKYLGTTYAFADTLRGRDNRRGLHTCTREDCCGGAWHKAVVVGGTDMSGKTDAEALRAFLGQDWEDHMSGYSTEKKREIIIQAHVFALANEHGKHKSAFERRSTPPGFWDTDFPTTQQVQENRVKAEELVKRQIGERWREAMREGGRWLFRDE